jgi:hypothetical protein
LKRRAGPPGSSNIVACRLYAKLIRINHTDFTPVVRLLLAKHGKMIRVTPDPFA